MGLYSGPKDFQCSFLSAISLNVVMYIRFGIVFPAITWNGIDRSSSVNEDTGGSGEYSPPGISSVYADRPRALEIAGWRRNTRSANTTFRGRDVCRLCLCYDGSGRVAAGGRSRMFASLAPAADPTVG